MVMNARYLAYQLVYKTLYEGQYFGLAISSIQQDRAFITRLATESLQNYSLMKHQFAALLDKAVPKDVELVLVMGCVQHFLMDAVEEYAIVNESVNLVKKVKPSFRGLVNAIMRQMVNQEIQYPQDLATRYSHPQWMVNLLVKQLGESDAISFLQHNNQPAIHYVRLNDDSQQEDILENYPIEKQNDDYIALPALFQTDALSRGLVIIQDKASQQVVKMFDEVEGNILDACGAPGTKTSQLAQRFKNSSIVMLDLHEHRVKLASDLMQRLNINNVTCLQADATKFDQGLYDAILCDVPCSGLGVLRRKPDLRWRIKGENLDELQVLQAAILDNVSKLLKPGGQLVYSTCTINKKENQQQVAAFIERHPQFVLKKEQLIKPYQNNSDGFYMALLVKEKAAVL